MRHPLAALALVAALLPGGAWAGEVDHAFGASLGTPSGLNLEYEFEHPVFHLALSGMYYGELYGVQVGLSPDRARADDGRLRLQAVLGTELHEDERRRPVEWTYAGVELVFTPARFLLAGGMNFGTGSYNSPQLGLRIGFLI